MSGSPMIYLAKAGIQSAHGTPQTTLQQLMLAQRPNVNPQAGGKIAIPGSKTSFGPDKEVAGPDYGTVDNLVHYLNPAAAAGTPPLWGIPLRASAHAETITAGTSVAYNVVDSGHEEMTLEAVHHLSRYEFTDLLASSLSLDFSNGQFPTISFAMAGNNQLMQEAALTEDEDDFELPIVVDTSNTTATLFGETVCFTSLTLDGGVQGHSPVAFAGCDQAGITNVAWKGSITIKNPGMNAKNWIQASIDNDEGAFLLTHGPAGKQIEISAADVSLGAVDANASAENTNMLTIPLQFNSGLVITTK